MIDARLAEALKEYERRTPKSAAIWNHAKMWTPLGVHSNYRSLDPYPFYVHRASRVSLWDADGTEYLDFNMGFGGLASGHAHPKIVEALSQQLERGSLYGYEWEKTPEVAERISPEVRDGPGPVQLDRPRGDPPRDADRPRRHRPPVRREVRGRLPRLPRHAPRRRRSPAPRRRGRPTSPRSSPAGPGSSPRSPSGPASPRSTTSSRRRAICREHADDVAAIIVEPIPMNMGFVMPEDGFLEGLRELADELGALLVFDEIKTGAKYPHGGAGRLESARTSCSSASRSRAGPRSPPSPRVAGCSTRSGRGRSRTPGRSTRTRSRWRAASRRSTT